ncbi:MAG: RodZ domain-containing protein [Pseudodesulfovibrio sp.]
MDFEELGSILREAREKKGLSIAVVMEATKISRTNLTALENGDRSALPHPVYAKGFVRSYARYLGLDAEELCMVVDREFQDHPKALKEHGYDVAPMAEKAFHDHETGDSGKRRSGLPLLLILVVLIAIVIALIFWVQEKQPVAPATESSATVEQAQPPAEPVVPAPEAAPAAPEQESAPADIPAEAETPAVTQPPPIMPEPLKKAEPAKPVPPKKETPVAGDGAADMAAVVKKDPGPGKEMVEDGQDKQKFDHVIIIRATTEKGCWIGVWKGGETNMARDFVLKEGEPLRLMFNHPRRIRIGNVSGVTVTYNGDPYPLDLKRGNIQTLTFGSE